MILVAALVEQHDECPVELRDDEIRRTAAVEIGCDDGARVVQLEFVKTRGCGARGAVDRAVSLMTGRSIKPSLSTSTEAMSQARVAS